MNTITEPIAETVNWEEIRPPCSVRYPIGMVPQCNAPADWWHKHQCCKNVTFCCDRHHDIILADDGQWGCARCKRFWAPARDNIESMGRL